MVLKKLIFNSFYIWEGCGGPDKNSFLTVSLWAGCGGLN